MGDRLIPATPSPRFTRFFARYCERMLARSFADVRVTPESPPVLGTLDTIDAPAIAAINHASWWDPLVGLVLAQRFVPSRVLASPIEAEQLRKFKFMRKIGLFGVEPDDRHAFRAFVDHATGLFSDNPRTLLGLTPQGAFTDVRTPVRLRPGVAAVAARLAASGTPPRVVSVACEYTFWADKKPVLLIHAGAVEPPPTPSTPAWTRAIGDAMERDRIGLASRSMARDASAFEPLLGPGGASIHPVYDLWLRLRGKRARIETGPGREGPPGGNDASAKGTVA